MMWTGEIIYEKVYVSPRLPPKISFIDYWFERKWGSEVDGGGKRFLTHPTKDQKSKCKISWDLFLVEQPSGSNAQEIDIRFLLCCESTNCGEHGDLLTVVCQVSVERLDQDKGRRRKRRRRSMSKNGATRWKWTIHRFVHTARGK